MATDKTLFNKPEASTVNMLTSSDWACFSQSLGMGTSDRHERWARTWARRLGSYLILKDDGTLVLFSGNVPGHGDVQRTEYAPGTWGWED